jgi:hypothetical protein
MNAKVKSCLALFAKLVAVTAVWCLAASVTTDIRAGYGDSMMSSSEESYRLFCEFRDEYRQTSGAPVPRTTQEANEETKRILEFAGEKFPDKRKRHDSLEAKATLMHEKITTLSLISDIIMYSFVPVFLVVFIWHFVKYANTASRRFGIILAFSSIIFPILSFIAFYGKTEVFICSIYFYLFLPTFFAGMFFVWNVPQRIWGWIKHG